MRDLSRATDPIQRAEWARENLREALRYLRSKLEALAKAIDDAEREESRAKQSEDDPATEAFVDVADAERFAQRDEYVDYAEATTEPLADWERELLALPEGEPDPAVERAFADMDATDDAVDAEVARHWASGHDMATCSECADQYAAEQRADAEFQAARDAESEA